jgi:CRP-like cAMP-binding protein
MSEMGPGTVFSKVAVLCNIVPQLFTVRTRHVCELLKLDKSVLARILQTYPKDSRQMLDNLKKVSI